ncbi:MAG: hypothetical protein PVG06_10555 [Desulfobacterales bacterium]|jgi:hypothetical protein
MDSRKEFFKWPAEKGKEEIDFIRKNLQQGLSVDEVIAAVEKEYGHRIS